MASSRKRSNASLAVALSGGVDSVVLLHRFKKEFPRVTAIHVHHGLSPNADAWARFCARLCRRLGVPMKIMKVKVTRKGQGLEAAARAARYRAFLQAPAEAIALAHNLDDQAETVLMNLLRGAGTRGASGMAPQSRFQGKTLLRPLLDLPRSQILDYARRHGLEWIEDESNADESLTRNFIRRRVGPLLEQKYPQWKQSLARAARHFANREAGREDLLRSFLRSRGMKAPSEAKLVEMLKQLTAGGARTSVNHDGARLRVYRGKLSIECNDPGPLSPVAWKGQAKLVLPGGELRFRRVRGKGFDAGARALTVHLRAGGERLQPDAHRPRRTLKNLFQEAGVPPWQRDRLPMLYCGKDLVWVPGLGIDSRFLTGATGLGWVPEWRPNSLFLRKSAAGHAKIAG